MVMHGRLVQDLQGVKLLKEQQAKSSNSEKAALAAEVVQKTTEAEERAAESAEQLRDLAAKYSASKVLVICP